MKRATKLWLLAAAALVVLGMLAFICVMALNHWDYAALGSPVVNNLETKTVDIGEDFQNIDLRSDTSDISFLPSKDGKCRVEFYEPKNVRSSAAVQDGTLNIEVTDKGGSWLENISLFSVGSSSITVYLPKAQYAALTIEEHTGEIALPKDFSFERIGIAASTGDVTCLASASGSLQIGTDTGMICLEDVSAGALALSVTTGRVEARGVDCAGAMSLDVSTGKAFLTDVTCRSFSSGGSTGDITLENVVVGEKLSVERSTGDVQFERCDAGELLVQTSTGDVSGTLRTEKVFITQSDTGKIDVPETTSGGKCKITTDTGNIKISVA